MEEQQKQEQGADGEQKVEQKDGEAKGEDQKGEEEKPEPVKLGPMSFTSGMEMFQYFYELLHHWCADMDFNEYEHMVLTELINKGHNEPEKKIGAGIKAFQIRLHPKWKSKCYYLVRTDGSFDDFSYRKCVDKLMKLPPEFFNNFNNGGAGAAASGGSSGRGGYKGGYKGGHKGRGGGRGRGRGRH